MTIQTFMKHFFIKQTDKKKARHSLSRPNHQRRMEEMFKLVTMLELTLKIRLNESSVAVRLSHST